MKIKTLKQLSNKATNASVKEQVENTFKAFKHNFKL